MPEKRKAARVRRLLSAAAAAALLLRPGFTAAGADDPGAVASGGIFAPFLVEGAPSIVEVVSREVEDGVEITRLRFLSRVFAGADGTEEKVIVFGVLARPARGEGPRPGMLVCHGGGGSAEAVAGHVAGWARRGYAAFGQDQPGIMGASAVQTSGPWEKYGAARWNVEPDASFSLVYDGVAAALNGLRILRAQPDVDRARIGVTGGSWGGYMTTMVAGLAGERVAAAFSVYGGGFYEHGSSFRRSLDGLEPAQRARWLEHLDAGRRAGNIRAPYFIAAATNDWFFWPGSVMATLEEIPAEKNLLWSPNDSHAIRVPGGEWGPAPFSRSENRVYMEIPWMEYHLEGRGEPFPRCTALEGVSREGDEALVRFRVAPAGAAREAHVFYAPGEMPWRMRRWRGVRALEIEPGVYRARLPVHEPELPLTWFGSIVEERDITVSTMMSDFLPAVAGFDAGERRDDLFAEDFEAAARTRWAGGEISPAAARGGENGLVLRRGRQARNQADGNGFRAEAAGRAGAAGIAFWARSEDGAGLQVMLRGEDESGGRHAWQASVSDLGPEWKRVEVRWDEFRYQGAGAPPFEMLSARTGQLCFGAAREAVVHVDDIALITAPDPGAGPDR